jgi:hypothetical protein
VLLTIHDWCFFLLSSLLNELTSACPHGSQITTWLIILAILAVVASNFATWMCDFVDVPGVGAIGLFRGNDQAGDYEDVFGSSYECVWWSSDTSHFDAAWRSARVFGILAWVCFVVGMILILALSCARLGRPKLLLVAMVFLMGGAFQLLTLLLLASDTVCGGPTGCDLSAGAGLAIGAAVVAFVAAVLVKLVVSSSSSSAV